MHTNDGLTLLAYGYEAEICPERGANLLRLACPELKTDALRTPLSIENMVQDNPYLWGIPILFPPNRISGASFTFQNRVYRWPMNEPDTGCFFTWNHSSDTFSGDRTYEYSGYPYLSSHGEQTLPFLSPCLYNAGQLRANTAGHCAENIDS